MLSSVRLNLLTALSLFVATLAVATALVVSLPQESSAADAKDFKPGRIIDDAIFYNGSAMNASQVQSFLNEKVPTCDTNGTGRASEFGSSLTRAQYAASRGWQSPPYTCLKNYKYNTPQVEAASGLCSGLSAQNNRTGAQIITDIANACGINPQVLIVLLEKEQSLVTDIWPLNTQYKHATGFACPDTAPCNDDYAGFFHQVYAAAKQFKIYKAYPNQYNYVAGRNNTVRWSPTVSCGTSTFYIENQATAALYIYTPYRPNQAALNNLYGSGDSCSAYGNRNFWRLFTDWFGSTTGAVMSSPGLQIYGWKTGDTITAAFNIHNISKSTLNIDYIRVRAANENDDAYFFAPVSSLKVAPGERYRYSKSLTMNIEGNYTFYLERKVGSTWYSTPFSDLNYTGKTSETRTITHKPSINSSLQFDKTSVHANEPITASFTATNSSAITSANIGTLKVEAVDSSNRHYQFGSDYGVVLAPGGTYKYSKTASFTRPGKLQFEIVNNSDIGWNTTYPASANSSIQRKVSIDVKQQATLTEGLSISQTAPHAGDTITASFKVRNFGSTPFNVGLLKVQATDSKGTIHQFDSTSSTLTLAPGEEYTYTSSRPAPQQGSYTFQIVNRNSAGWNTTYPASETSSIGRKVTVNVAHPVEMTESLTITPSPASTGQTVNATFTVRNFGTQPADVGLLKVQSTDANQNMVYQFNSTASSLVLQPGEEYTYTASLALTKAGTHRFYVVNKHPTLGWNSSLPPAQSSGIQRATTVTVN